MHFFMFQERVHEKAKGELIIKYRGGPEAIATYQLTKATQTGVADMAYIYTGAYTGLIPAVESLVASQISPQEERERGFVELFREEHKKAGLFYLGRAWAEAPPGQGFNLYVEKPIEKPQELAELEIGGIGAVNLPFVKALGASPVVLPYPEHFVAIERGVVSGSWGVMVTVVHKGIHELNMYMIDHSYYSTNTVFLVNLDKWNRLPPHLQDLLIDAFEETEQEILPTLPSILEGFRQTMLAPGKIKLIKFSPEDAEWFENLAYQSLWDDLMKRFPDIAPKYRELLTK